MEITTLEAATALGVSLNWIVNIYQGQVFYSEKALVDTEVLCKILGFDHRFMMAFLAGYDIALAQTQVAALFHHNKRWVRSKANTVPVFCYPPDSGFGKHGIVRYSYRRVAPLLLAHMEKNNERRNTASKFGGGAVLPPPDHLPAHSWTFRSTIEVEGKRLPRAYRTELAHGSSSALPVLARPSEE